MAVVVENWRDILKRSFVVYVAVAGAVLPEVPDLVLRWLSADDASSQLLSSETKNIIRGLLMFFVIPLVRVWKQKSIVTVSVAKDENGPPNL